MDNSRLKVSKIDAARRQLDSAIEMWFYDRDPVAVHTLAAAAYQIIHDINRQKGSGLDLLYDSIMVKDEYRSQWVNLLKAPSNFFKHADRDPGEIAEMPLEASLLFFVFSIRGLDNLGEKTSAPANVLLNWLQLNRPKWTTPEFQKRFSDHLGAEGIQTLRAVPKREYFEKAIQVTLAKRGFG